MRHHRLIALLPLVAAAVPAAAQTTRNPGQVGPWAQVRPVTHPLQDDYPTQLDSRAAFNRATRSLSDSQRSIAWAVQSGNYATALAALDGLATAGDPWASRQLGWMHRRGLGVAADSRVAARYFLAAANQGDPPSALALGYAFQRGDGVDADPVRSRYWLERAQQSGDRAVRRDAARLLRRN